MKRLLLILFCLFNFSLSLYSQTKDDESPKQKQAEKTKEKQIKSAKRAEEEGIKKHEALQTKEVRRRMRKNKRRYAHVDSFDRRPNFFQRLFPHKRPSAN